MSNRCEYEDVDDIVLTGELSNEQPVVPSHTEELPGQGPMWPLAVKDQHYKGKVEAWDVIDDMGLSWLAGNVVKYLVRHRRKDGKKDIIKALDYLLKEATKHYDISRQELEEVVNKHDFEGGD